MSRQPPEHTDPFPLFSGPLAHIMRQKGCRASSNFLRQHWDQLVMPWVDPPCERWHHGRWPPYLFGGSTGRRLQSTGHVYRRTSGSLGKYGLKATLPIFLNCYIPALLAGRCPGRVRRDMPNAHLKACLRCLEFWKDCMRLSSLSLNL